MIKYVLFDWDGTVSPGYSILPWTDNLVEKALFSAGKRRDIREAFRQHESGRRGYEWLCEETAGLYSEGLAGRPKTAVDRAGDEFVGEGRHPINPIFEDIFMIANLNMINIVVVSGAPSSLLKAYAKKYHISRVYSLDVEADADGRFLPSVRTNYGLSRSKLEAVNDLLKPGSEVIMAFGNSLADAPLFEASRRGVLLDNTAHKFPAHVASKIVEFSQTDIRQELLRAIGGN